MKIFLCGFSGAGKSTLGEKLSKSSTFQIFDLDEEIYNRMGSGFDSLAEYIEEIGIDEFRKDELDMIKLLDRNFKDNYLIILGGGALETAELREHIKSVDGRLVYLNADFETCWKRISQAGDRPLAKKGQDFMESLYNQRLGHYQEAALTLSQEAASQIDTIEHLITRLN